MANKKKAVKIVGTHEQSPFEKERESFEIRRGREIPPIVRESKYPWGKMVELLAEDPENYPSFFVKFDSREAANSSRSMIQGSGRNYYSGRRMPFEVTSRVVEEDGIVGVESWVYPRPTQSK